MSKIVNSASAALPGWKRRGTFLLAATGSAFGLGNIWKLPYITGLYGGGAFVLVFLGCILLVGIPIMMAETLLGRLGRANPVGTMRSLGTQAGQVGRWTWLGGMGVIGGLLIMMFYSVVAGWVLAYVINTASGELRDLNPEEIAARFDTLGNDVTTQAFFHSIFIVMTGAIGAGGVTRGTCTRTSPGNSWRSAWNEPWMPTTGISCSSVTVSGIETTIHCGARTAAPWSRLLQLRFEDCG